MPSSPQLVLSEAEQDDLELLLAGALAPLTGFAAPDTGITLTAAPADAPDIGATVRLVDAEGAPLAELDVTAIHPAGDEVAVAGPVRALAAREPRPFESRYLPAADVRARTGEHLLVPVEQPLTAADLTDITERAGDRPVLLLALAGAGRPVELSPAGLIRASVAAADLLPRAEVVAVPLARHPQRDAEIRNRVLAAYRPGGVRSEAAPSSPPLSPAHRGPLPDPVAAAVHLDRRSGTDRGLVVLLTGLSGSGKSTIARGVRNALVEAGGRAVTLLDGDVVRRHLSAGLGFSRQDRDTNIRRIGWVAAEISRHGGTAIASPIAPFDATRRAVRAMVDDAGGAFVLVHVATPLAECERRDRKGLYARARAGEIPDFTGISSPYEEPTDADLRIDTTGGSVDDEVARVLDELRARGLVR